MASPKLQTIISPFFKCNNHIALHKTATSHFVRNTEMLPCRIFRVKSKSACGLGKWETNAVLDSWPNETCEQNRRSEQTRQTLQHSATLLLIKAQLQIFNANFLRLKALPQSSIDLIVTSPPYNLDIQYGVHDDGTSYSDYLEFCHEWLSKCLLLAKDDGRLCLNVPLDKNKGGKQSVCADITSAAKKCGLEVSINNYLE